MDNSSLTPEFLLREAYELLWHEHRITSTEVGEGFELGQLYHAEPCDVCGLLESIDRRMGISLESWARNLSVQELDDISDRSVIYG